MIRRKPSRWFHLIVWNTQTDEFIHGSWLNGTLYPLRSDVSFDGRYLVYLAMVKPARTWNGLCELPWLKTIDEARNTGTWHGGGYWSDEFTLHTNGWDWDYQSGPPGRAGTGGRFRVVAEYAAYGGHEGVLYPRMERDGWQRQGPFGTDRELKNARQYTAVRDGDAGWKWERSPEHPALYCFYRGYFSRHSFEFAMPEYPGVIDPDVDWTCWDALGQLIVARDGRVERYSLADLATGRPGLVQSFEDLQPPGKSTERQET